MATGARRSRRFCSQLPNTGRKSTGVPTLKRTEARAPVFMRWLLEPKLNPRNAQRGHTHSQIVLVVILVLVIENKSIEKEEENLQELLCFLSCHSCIAWSTGSFFQHEHFAQNYFAAQRARM